MMTLRVKDSTIKDDQEKRIHLWQVVLQVDRPAEEDCGYSVVVTQFVLAEDATRAIGQATCHLERSGMKVAWPDRKKIEEKAVAIQLPLLVQGWGANIH